MSKIRSKWTTLDRGLHNVLKGRKIKHRMYPKIAGSPDVVLTDNKIAIFLNGCFWHGCPKCYRKPRNNADFWKRKVVSNKVRDQANARKLRKEGWKVVTLWEHKLIKDQNKVLSKLLKSV